MSTLTSLAGLLPMTVVSLLAHLENSNDGVEG